METTKTNEELMSMFETARSRLGGMNQNEEVPWKAYDELIDMLDYLKAGVQSEVEAAERRRTEELKVLAESKVFDVTAALSIKFPPHFTAGGGLVGRQEPQAKVLLDMELVAWKRVVLELNKFLTTPER